MFGLTRKQVLGHLGYQNVDIETLAKLVSRGRLDLSRSISEIVPLEDIPRASRSWSARTATRSGFWSSPEERADPVQHQLGSLLDDPVANAVDQLDLEIACAVAISVAAGRV